MEPTSAYSCPYLSAINNSDIDATVHNDYPEIPLMMTVDQAAELLLISRPSCYGLVATGALKSIRYGRKIRISRDSMIEYIRNASA